MADVITIGAQALQPFEDWTTNVLEVGLPGRTVENHPDVVAIGIDCKSSLNQSDLILIPTASHGYWIDTGVGNYERIELRYLHNEQQSEMGLVGAGILGDKFLALRTLLLRNTSMTPRPEDDQETYEYVQFRYFALMYRTVPDIRKELEAHERRGGGIDDLIGGMMAIGCPQKSPVAGHALLSDLARVTKMARSLILCMSNHQYPELFDRLMNTRVEITLPDALSPNG
jgi:hypothetical protein